MENFIFCGVVYSWLAHFYTNRKESRYPPDGDTLYFDKEVKPYSSKKPTPITISNKTKTKNEEKFQQWSARYTQAVKQRTLRQENTIAKMGTLSQFIYLKNTKEIAERIKSRKKERSKWIWFIQCWLISFLRIWSHLLKKSLIENFIFCAVNHLS